MADAPLERAVEALLLAAERPLVVADVTRLLNEAADEEEWPRRVEPGEVETALTGLAARAQGRGVRIELVGGGYQLRTAPDLAPLVRRLWPTRATRLSRAALEALAIVAYRQPCTRLDVEEIRGVDSGGVLRSLLERRLLRIIGRMDEPGRPLLYGTTPQFLETFSLAELRALPTLRDLDSLRAEEEARQRGQLADAAESHADPEPAAES